MFDYKAIIANIEYSVENRGLMGISTECKTMQSGLEIGTVSPTRINMTIVPNVDNIYEMDTVELFMREDGGDWQPRGKYYIERRPMFNSGSVMSIEGFDELKLLNRPFTENEMPEYPVSMRNLIDIIGIPLDERTESIINPYFVTFSESTEIIDMLAEIAAAHSGNFIMTHEGKLRLVQINTKGEIYDIKTHTQKIERDRIGLPVTRLTIGDGNITFTTGGGAGKHIELFIENATQAMCNSIFNQIRGYVYTPFSSGKSDISEHFEIGDTVIIDGNEFTIYNHHTVYSATIRSELSAPFVTGGGFGGAVSRRDDKGAGRIPDIFYDVNKEAIRIEQTEIQIGEIEVDVTVSSNAQGHLQLAFLSDKESKIHIRVYDNDIQLPFSPVVEQIVVGINVIDISHLYLRTLQGEHLFKVTAQTKKGYCNINTRALMYSINLVAGEIFGITQPIRDMSIQQVQDALEPTGIYTIVNEGGSLSVWVLRFIMNRRFLSRDMSMLWHLGLENIRECAIEFNGIYQPIGEGVNERHAFVTDGKPYIFFIDNEYRLWVQYGDEIITRMLLATNATKVSVCRTWNHIDHPDYDTGLVVAYIKFRDEETDQQNVVAYRSLTGTVIGNRQWQPEQLLDEAGESNFDVHVHRFNDYRIGFTTGRAEYVTRKYLSGQAVKPEFVNFDSEQILNLFNADAPFEPLTIIKTWREVNSMTGEPRTAFYAEFNYSFWLRDNRWFRPATVTVQGRTINVERHIYSGNTLIFILDMEVTKFTEVRITTTQWTFLMYSVDDNNSLYMPVTTMIWLPARNEHIMKPEYVSFDAEVRIEIDNSSREPVVIRKAENVNFDAWVGIEISNITQKEPTYIETENVKFNARVGIEINNATADGQPL